MIYQNKIHGNLSLHITLLRLKAHGLNIVLFVTFIRRNPFWQADGGLTAYRFKALDVQISSLEFFLFLALLLAYYDGKDWVIVIKFNIINLKFVPFFQC